MIQRIQSILLLITGVLMLVFLFVPTWQNQNKPDTQDGKVSDVKVALTPFSLMLTGTEKFEERTQENIVKEQKILNETKNTIYIAVLAIAVAAVSFYSIFQFRNRLLQIKLGAFSSMVMCLIIVCAYINIMQGNKMLSNHAEGEFQVGFYMPIIGILLNLLANRFIRKDEQLVKSADRIR